jgi:hypothetical protein
MWTFLLGGPVAGAVRQGSRPADPDEDTIDGHARIKPERLALRKQGIVDWEPPTAGGSMSAPHAARDPRARFSLRPDQGLGYSPAGRGRFPVGRTSRPA